MKKYDFNFKIEIKGSNKNAIKESLEHIKNTLLNGYLLKSENYGWLEHERMNSKGEIMLNYKFKIQRAK